MVSGGIVVVVIVGVGGVMSGQTLSLEILDFTEMSVVAFRGGCNSRRMQFISMSLSLLFISCPT